MTDHAPLMKKRGREGRYCNNRHCPSRYDANMRWYDHGAQRTQEKLEWKREDWGDDDFD